MNINLKIAWTDDIPRYDLGFLEFNERALTSSETSKSGSSSCVLSGFSGDVALSLSITISGWMNARLELASRCEELTINPAEQLFSRHMLEIFQI